MTSPEQVVPVGRSLVAISSIFAFLMIAVALLSAAFLPDRKLALPLAAVGGVFALLSAFGRGGELRLSEEGIRWKAFQRWDVRWSEIERLEIQASSRKEPARPYAPDLFGQPFAEVALSLLVRTKSGRTRRIHGSSVPRLSALAEAIHVASTEGWGAVGDSLAKRIGATPDGVAPDPAALASNEPSHESPSLARILKLLALALAGIVVSGGLAIAACLAFLPDSAHNAAIPIFMLAGFYVYARILGWTKLFSSVSRAGRPPDR